MKSVKKTAWAAWLLPVAGVAVVVAAYFALLKPVDYAGARPAPAVLGRQLDGKMFNLADLRDKRAALLVFWASW